MPSRIRQWRLNVAIVNAIEFVSESARGLVMPSLYLYCLRLGGDLDFMIYITVTFSIGRMLSGLLFGYLMDHSCKKNAYVLSLILASVGQVLDHCHCFYIV